MKSDDLSCWKCGASLAEVLLPLSRLAKCKSCNADLHVCRMCEFFDTTVNNSCREPVAEKVTDKQGKNFCGYLQPSANAFHISNPDQAAAKNQLDALFGLDMDKHDDEETSKEPLSEAEKSRRKLEELFKPDKKS